MGTEDMKEGRFRCAMTGSQNRVTRSPLESATWTHIQDGKWLATPMHFIITAPPTEATRLAAQNKHYTMTLQESLDLEAATQAAVAPAASSPSIPIAAAQTRPRIRLVQQTVAKAKAAAITVSPDDAMHWTRIEQAVNTGETHGAPPPPHYGDPRIKLPSGKPIFTFKDDTLFWYCNLCRRNITTAHLMGRDHQKNLAYLVPTLTPAQRPSEPPADYDDNKTYLQWSKPEHQ